MLKTGILNPALNSLLSRIRHTNTVVIADRGFPYWRDIEVVDLSLIDNIPTVLQVFDAIRHNFSFGKIWMASEFRAFNSAATLKTFDGVMANAALTYLPHADFKQLVPNAIGLIRTGDTTQYANLIIESA